MNGKRKRKSRRKAPMTILAIMLLAAGLSIILVPALLKSIELSHDAIEYEALVEQAKIMNTAEPRTDDPAEQPIRGPVSETAPPGASATEAPEAAPNATEESTGAPVEAAPATTQPGGSHSGSGTSKPAASPSATAPSTDAPVKVGNTGADLSALKAMNSDFIAWLQIPGTKVDFPVVLTDDIDYYLTHLFNGKESSLGTLFSLGKTDYRTPGKNIAIYGHNVRSSGKQMLAALASYKKKSYYDTHATIYLDTVYHASTYTIFAVIDMTSGDWDASISSFATERDFLDFIGRAKALSLYDTGVEVTAEDRVLTLITCDRDYGGKDGRLVIMAVEQ